MDRSAELRRDWAACVSPQQFGGWDTTNTYLPPIQTHMHDSAYNSLDSSNSLSGSGSPFQSPGTHAFRDTLQQQTYSTLDPSSIPRNVGMDVNKAHWTTSTAMRVDEMMDQSTASFAVYGHMPGPPPLATHVGYQEPVEYEYGLEQ